MKRTKQITLTILAIFLFSSCEFVKNAFTYKDKTAEFVKAVINEDYDKAVGYFAMEHEMANNTDVEKMKIGLVDFRERIVTNFGTELDYTFMKAEKKFSTIEKNNTPPNATVAFIEFSNDKNFGVFKVLFDDNSGKIMNINMLDVNKAIPSMTLFWFFGILALCVPIFNIYIIRKIKKSDLKKKRLKYIAIIFLNVPALTYAAVNGFSFSLLSFQILLGISFSYMGYLSAAWTFGLPLGGLYWFWKLRIKKTVEIEMFEKSETIIENLNKEDSKE